MAILGEAWIVLRAITDKLHGDVQKGLDDSAKQVDQPGQNIGQKFADALSKGVKDKLGEDFGVDLFDGLDIGAPDGEVDSRGQSKGKTWASGFFTGLKNIFKDIGVNTKDLVNGTVSDSTVQSSGTSKGRGWASSFAGGISSGFRQFDAVVSGLVMSLVSDSEMSGDGKAKAATWVAGFASGLGSTLQGVATSLLAALTPLLTVGGIAGLIGAAAGAVTDLAVGLVSLIGPLSAVTSLLGVGAVAGFSALIEGATLGSMWLKDLTASAKKVPPAAAEARAEFQKFQTGFKNMVAEVGNDTVFPALNKLFTQLSTGSMPLLKGAVTSMGQAFASVIGTLNDALKNPIFSGNLAVVFRTNSVIVQDLGKAFVSLAQVFTTLIAAASPVIIEFTNWFAQLADHLNSVTAVGQATGKLGTFFQHAGEIAKELGGILSNLFQSITAIAKAAAPMGEALLGGWLGAARALNEYLHSAQGVQAMGNFFDPNGQVRQNLSSIGSLLKPLLIDLGDLAKQPGIQELANGIRSALPGITVLLESATNAVGGLAQSLGKSLANPAGTKGIADLSGALQSLGGTLSALTPAVGPLLSVVGQLVSAFSDSLRPALSVLQPALIAIEPAAQKIGTALGQVLGAAIEALIPLIPPLVNVIGQVTAAFGGPLSSSINVVATLLGALTPIIQVLGTVVSALAPELTTLATAFAAFKIASAVGSGLKSLAGDVETVGLKAAYAAEGMGASAGTVGKMTGAFGAVADTLGQVGGKLGLFGAIAGAAIGGVSLLIGMIDKLDTADRVMTISQEGVTSALQASAGAIDQNVEKTAALTLQQAGAFDWAQKWGLSLGTVTQAALGNQSAIAQVNAASSNYIINGQIAGNVTSTQAAQSKDAASKIAGMGDATKGTVEQQKQLAAAVQQAGGNTGQAVSQIQELANKAGSANSEVSLLKGSLDSLTGTATSTLQAQTNLAQAVAQAETGFKGLKGETINANGALDLTTEAGRGASQSLLQIQSNTNSLIATMEKNGSTAAETSAAWDQSRQSFINAAVAMNIPADAANKLADQLLGIPADVHTKISADTAQANADLKGTSGQVTTLDGQSANPSVTVDPTQANGAIGQVKAGLASVNGPQATAIADVDWGRVASGVAAASGALTGLGNEKPTPIANLNIGPLQNLSQAGLDDLGILAGQKPTPKAGLDTGALNAGVLSSMNQLGNVGNQRPTPILGANNSILTGVTQSSLAALAAVGAHNVAPNISVIDLASGTISVIQGQLNKIHDKTITVTTVSAFRAGAAATGGLIADDQWTTVGEHGRELIFASKGQYVATYQQAQAILSAARMQAGQSVNGPTSSGSGAVAVLDAGNGGGGVSVTNNIFPSAGMDERALAQAVGVETAYTVKRV